MEITEITVYRKGTGELITRIFEDGEVIKEITSDEYEVDIKTQEEVKQCHERDRLER